MLYRNFGGSRRKLKVEHYRENECRERNEHIMTFIGFPDSSEEGIRRVLKKLQGKHIDCFITGGVGKHEGTLSYTEEYFEGMRRLSRLCREYGMTYFIQDGIPFPSGSAGGAFSLPENRDLNKIFIDERHMDVTGPMEGIYIRTGDLMRTIHTFQRAAFSSIDLNGRKRLAVIACRIDRNKRVIDGTAVDLSEYENNGFVCWNVPEGHWRIYVFYTTYESGGRPGFMNLLSRKSVEFELQKVHQPIYEHLKEELGKSWIGFFYDEPEIGNNGGSVNFDFQMLPGIRQQDIRNADVYPWSEELPEELDQRDPLWKLHLPYLFYDGGEFMVKFRFAYMDAVTKLIRDNYNGVIHAFCREHGIIYLGHVLEDGGSHARLGCGPGHYFRQQYYQDQAGIDVIAGQLRPGCDRTVSWYGIVTDDGELYHYGIAKLASSEAHINPLKKNQNIVENLAAFGTTAGPRYKKFLTDHLVVNGLNHIILSDLSAYGTPEEFVSEISDYTDRLCRLCGDSEPVIRAAILYHAEMEWAGEYEPFHTPASELARHQISYDVIPADVFSEPQLYRTGRAGGLSVNGHSYECLIIPGCRYLPDAAADFIDEKAKEGFPVLICDFAPETAVPSGRILDLKKYVVPRKDLAEAVQKAGKPDIVMEDAQWIRVLHLKDEEREVFLLHNEDPAADYEGTFSVRLPGPLYRVDPVSLTAEYVPSEETEQCMQTGRLSLLSGELIILCSGKENAGALFGGCKFQEPMIWENYSGNFSVSSRKHKEDQFSEEIILNQPKNMYPILGPDFFGVIRYRFTAEFNDKLPAVIDLGLIRDSISLRINGFLLKQSALGQKIISLNGLIRQGTNVFTADVWPDTVNYPPADYMGLPSSAFTGVAQTFMTGAGLYGPVRFGFMKEGNE